MLILFYALSEVAESFLVPAVEVRMRSGRQHTYLVADASTYQHYHKPVLTCTASASIVLHVCDACHVLLCAALSSCN